MEKIVVLDFGSQYAHLIAKRFRALGYYSEIALPSVDIDKLNDVKGIVLSGGPSSVYQEKKPEFNNKLLHLEIPILGLCYGHQLISQELGGKAGKAAVGEYGFANFEFKTDSPLFKNLKLPSQVWMSHSDEVLEIPEGFEIIGFTKDCKIAAAQNLKKKIFTFQFHAEVKDTPIGNKLFENFAEYSGIKKNWDTGMVTRLINDDIIKTAKNKKVLLFLSGGVDSSVAFGLLNNALGTDRVMGLYINNGFMRLNETEEIKTGYEKIGYNNFIIEDASSTFLKNVEGKTDPQEKRKIIGETFIQIRDEVIKRLNLNEDEWLLGQGTLYPDIIESGGTKHSHTIKTHHNRVAGIEQLIEKGLVIEPLKDLYKDEVRVIGRSIGIPGDIVDRHPFPGPGLSINVLCSDGVYEKELFEHASIALKNYKLDKYIKNKYLLYPIPVKSVGVQGDFRTYKYPACLDISDFIEKSLDWKILETISSDLTNNISDINRTILNLFTKKECILNQGFCNKERLDMTRIVDDIVIREFKNTGWYKKIFQHLTICLPYSNSLSSCSIVLRPVCSEDVMTARFTHIDIDILQKIVEKIKALDFVDALYYDITNKPPATFGWE